MCICVRVYMYGCVCVCVRFPPFALIQDGYEVGHGDPPG